MVRSRMRRPAGVAQATSRTSAPMRKFTARRKESTSASAGMKGSPSTKSLMMVPSGQFRMLWPNRGKP
jgi:hypothetical protein